MRPRVLPLIYVLIFAGVMFVLAYFTQSLNFGLASFLPFSIISFFSGCAIVLIAGAQFRHANTTVNPLNLESTSALVSTGIYRFSRNPMYVGFTLCLIAWLLLLGSLISATLLPVFIGLITVVQIKPEERMLQEKFGENYLAYQRRVRMWI